MILVLGTMLLGACGEGGGTAAPTPTGPASTTPSPTPSTSSPTPIRSPSQTRSATSPGPPSPTASPSPALSPTTAPTTPAPTTAAAPTTCTIPSRFRGADLEVLPTTRKVVALTFDAGSGAKGVAPILATLAEKKVPGTFFLKGEFVQLHPDESVRIARSHLVGNHTQTHPYLTQKSDAEVRDELRVAERVIRQRTGEDPRRFFRFPYGDRNAHTIDVVNSLCYVAFRWTVDTLGWKGRSEGATTASILDRVLGAARPGEIVLMHVGESEDGSIPDAVALPQVIDRLRGRGYGFVSLSEMMSAAP